MTSVTTYLFGLSAATRGQQTSIAVLVIVSAIIRVNMVLEEDGGP